MTRTEIAAAVFAAAAGEHICLASRDETRDRRLTHLAVRAFEAADAFRRVAEVAERAEVARVVAATPKAVAAAPRAPKR